MWQIVRLIGTTSAGWGRAARRHVSQAAGLFPNAISLRGITAVNSRKTLGVMVGEWVDRHRDTLVMVAMRRVRDGDEAEDVVQDAAITAMALVRSDPERLREIDDPRGWLVGITLNIARNTWKTRCRREGIRRKRQSEIRDELFPVPDSEGDVERLTEWTLETAEAILRPKQLAIVRGMLHGKSDAELSREGQIARATVRWHRRRAVRCMQEHIATTFPVGTPADSGHRAP